MKKVLFVVTTLEVGGIETYLLRFLSFAKDKVDATVFCKSGLDGSLEKKYRNLDVTIIKFKFTYFPVLGSIKLYRFLKKEKFDTVCDFSGDFAGLPLFLARQANIKNRLSFYRESKHLFKQDPFRMFYNKIVKFLVQKNATKILSNSQTALNYFYPSWQSNKKHFEIIRNGVPVEIFEVAFDKSKLRKELGIPNDAFVIGHVGRFHSSKNHKTIIKVAEQLCGEYKEVYFLLCGEGVEKGIRDIVGANKINSKIIMPGMRNDIPNVLRIMNAFYFPSLTEGQPNALIEAMVAGLPFVASDIDPIKETVAKNFYKYLTPPNDINQTIKLFRNFIEKRSDFPSGNLSEWAKNHYNAQKCFDQFFINL